MIYPVLNKKNNPGFTLIELLIVVGIIAILSSVILFAVGEARQKSRDTNRYQQADEFLKAVELYYSDNGSYPAGSGVTPVQISSIQADIIDYMPNIPTDPTYDAANGYYYCAATDQRTMAILVNTEKDSGAFGSNYCVISRGRDEYTTNVCNTTTLEGVTVTSIDRCYDRIDS